MKPKIAELRARIIDADPLPLLTSLHEFLLSEGMSRRDLRSILQLMFAFEDHRRGKPNPLLAVTKSSGGKAHAIDIEFKTAIAASMTLLQDMGRSKAEAKDLIEKRLRKNGRMNVTKTLVETWHRETTAARAAPDVRDAYNWYVAQIRERLGPDHSGNEENLLASLSDLAGLKL